MAAHLSHKRQQALAVDAPIAHQLYAAACTRFGAEAMQKNLLLLWTLRCMWGCTDELPFDATESKTLHELLWVARQVCGYGDQEKGTLWPDSGGSSVAWRA